MNTDNRKSLILDALRAFIAQRPGMDPRNYDRAGYLKESREVTRDRHQAETLLRAVEWRDSITADALLAASRNAYGGRLTIEELPPIIVGPGAFAEAKRRAKAGSASVRIDYCTGQYFPTEYRRAVCAVLASALWTWTRENAMPRPGSRPCGTYRVESEAGKYWNGKRWLSAGDWLRAHFAKEFGRGIASRWFN